MTNCKDNVATPTLLVIVHTEEEFDWASGFNRRNISVSHIDALPAIHEICVSKGFKQTFFCSYPIADNEQAAATLQSMIRDGSGEIGSHLHPWVCPPSVEEVSHFNSYPCNLPEELERAKLERLTRRIGEAFGRPPVAYLAGRYGFGRNTAKILLDLGYRVDCSIAPGWDDSASGGPDYRIYGPTPFRDEEYHDLLRIPHTNGHVGFLCRTGMPRIRPEGWPLAKMLRLPGIASRLGAVSRAKLSLEDSDPALMRQLVRDLYVAGQHLFALSYHSPSAAVGHTPYVQSAEDLKQFKMMLSDFLDFFSDEMGGVGITASEACSFFPAGMNAIGMPRANG